MKPEGLFQNQKAVSNHYRTYKHLKYSKGSKQEVHLYIALHAVEPKGLTSSVCLALQWGQSTSLGAPNMAFLSNVLNSGGAMP